MKYGNEKTIIRATHQRIYLLFSHFETDIAVPVNAQTLNGERYIFAFFYQLIKVSSVYFREENVKVKGAVLAYHKLVEREKARGMCGSFTYAEELVCRLVGQCRSADLEPFGTN